MKHIYAIFFGALASFVGSYAASFLGACMGWLYFSEGLWLVRVSLVPCILTALALSFSAPHVRRSRLVALCLAFITVVLAGSFGAIAIKSIRYGFVPVNVSGYFVWCWVYGAAFLPLSYPLTRFLQRVIQRCPKRQEKPDS